MEAIALEQKVNQLPFEMRQQVSDYLDFLLSKYRTHKPEDPAPAKPYAGCMKGTVLWMSDDFNEPLEDFKD